MWPEVRAVVDIRWKIFLLRLEILREQLKKFWYK